MVIAMANIEVKSSSINKKQFPKISFEDNQSITSNSYHKEELEMNKTIMKNALVMIWVGIAIIITFAFLYVFNVTDNIYIILSGVFVDFFSATILYLVKNSTKTKNEYFKESAKADTQVRLINCIHEISDEKDKVKILEKLINYIYSRK